MFHWSFKKTKDAVQGVKNAVQDATNTVRDVKNVINTLIAALTVPPRPGREPSPPLEAPPTA